VGHLRLCGTLGETKKTLVSKANPPAPLFKERKKEKKKNQKEKKKRKKLLSTR